MTVKEEISFEMKHLSTFDRVVFLGENIINSGRIYGTMDHVPIDKCIEMPVAENLIAGCGIGLALCGYFPIVVFQRMDFILIAADQIINHACLIPKMTGVKCPIIFRTIKATLNNKFYAGLQHTKDLSHVFTPYMEVIQVNSSVNINETYQRVYMLACSGKPVLVVENHESFNNEALYLEKGSYE